MRLISSNELFVLLVCFLHSRYGGERYEKRDMQIRVRENFRQLQSFDDEQRSKMGKTGKGQEGGSVPSWYVVNAAQSIEDVQKEINAIVERTIKDVQETNKPLGLLWKNDNDNHNDDNDQQQVSPKSTMDDIQG
jgi:hypothetical protein